jgi:hypothetical protein
MSPLVLTLLRRIALYALAVALLILVVPRMLEEAGVLGPSVEQEIAAAERAMEAAAAYGAAAEQPAYASAREQLGSARELHRRGQAREARRAARAARSHAFASQRAALATREEARRQAQQITAAIDKLVDELEDLYAQATPGLDKAAVARLFSMMKEVRKRGASLWLAYEQGSYAKVIQEERATKEALLEARRVLLGVKGADGAKKDRP